MQRRKTLPPAPPGAPEGTDERMLELLEHYRGQRFRVIRLLGWASRRAPHVLAGG